MYIGFAGRYINSSHIIYFQKEHQYTITIKLTEGSLSETFKTTIEREERFNDLMFILLGESGIA